MKGGWPREGSQPQNVDLGKSRVYPKAAYLLEELGLIQLGAVQFVVGVTAPGVEYLAVVEHR
jgi:hypothetical protein